MKFHNRIWIDSNWMFILSEFLPIEKFFTLFPKNISDPAKFGKQVGGDILQNKKTLLVLKTLETAPEADRKELLSWMQTGTEHGDEKVEAVRAIFNRNNIPQIIALEKEKYQESAFLHLASVQAPDDRKSVLRKMIEDLLERER